MIIKVKLEGELLEALKKDAEHNLRTHPAQIIYYLREIYADQLGTSVGAIPSPSTYINTTKDQEGQVVETLVITPEQQDKITGSDIHQEVTIDIPDDILNF